MAKNRDTNKRLKGIGIPIEICVKYERMAGLAPGQKPTFVEKIHVSELMISALEAYARDVRLTAVDYELIAEEVRQNEEDRDRKGREGRKGREEDGWKKDGWEEEDRQRRPSHVNNDEKYRPEHDR